MEGLWGGGHLVKLCWNTARLMASVGAQQPWVCVSEVREEATIDRITHTHTSTLVMSISAGWGSD